MQIEVEDSRPIEAKCDDEFLTVALADGRILRTPLWWYPRLATASREERNVVELSPMGMHWPQVDEDISVASMLRGQRAPGAVPPERAA
ncbi:DUF2442 domain-containing protein [Methylocystis sp. JR02]|nr:MULTISPECIES: DUF2442 domain-containing protein [unclassified Methylocystis]MBL1257404.1 DUF2442 domain-containing protein [Methylocystis sp. Sn-Cys]MDJ0448985.1 DUF2442 domain-containing protein [Methylocystis sp. JR02]